MDIKQVFPTPSISGATMTEQQSLLAAIITNPDEDSPRSMYADYLQDSNDILDRKLGEYIKLSLELHTHKRTALVQKSDSIKEPEYNSDRGNQVDSYTWYRRGIELQTQINMTWQGISRLHSIYSLYFNEMGTNRFEFEVDRGFITSITCTASQFLSVCDKLIWHPSRVDECPECDGKGETRFCDAAGDMDDEPCRMCGGNLRGGYNKGTGKVVRPCPLTAHPVREIDITPIHDIQGWEVRELEKWTQRAKEYGIEFTIV